MTMKFADNGFVWNPNAETYTNGTVSIWRENWNTFRLYASAEPEPATEVRRNNKRTRYLTKEAVLTAALKLTKRLSK